MFELIFFARRGLVSWVFILLNFVSAVVQLRFLPHTWLHILTGVMGLLAGTLLAVVTILWRWSRRRMDRALAEMRRDVE